MMTKTHKKLAILLAGLIISANSAVISAATPASKPLLNKSKFSIGAGVSSNSVSGPADDETGFQFFAAYDLSGVNIMDGVKTSLEFGYMDYGFDGVDNDGIWGTAVVGGTINGSFGWLARLGLDLGDDSGIMLGAGVSYSLTNKFDTRLEYVVRDEIDSIQLNFIYDL